MPIAKLSVALLADGIAYKHWCLFYEGPTKEEEFIFNIMGSSTRYRYEMQNSNPHDSETLVEMIHLCNVDTSQFDVIKQAAETAIIHNEYPGYNCQDYVLELLDDLEKRGCIDNKDEKYKKQKKTVKDKQEGLM
ncbi:hypothetical protein MferCBS31731_007341 [Microsporum ferrugineum]